MMTEVIQEKLLEIEQKENVRILMAVESGSRAWGFASPDSDYDVRFLYVRKKSDYLRLDPVRDVIEWQLDDTLDINGWDIKKALSLLHSLNPTIFEWCMSPIVYRNSPEFEKFKKILPDYFSIKKSLYHYLHMAESNYRNYLKGEVVQLKKYFYVLRPLLAARWVMNQKCPPPILFTELMEAELEKSLVSEVERLLKMKQRVPEMGEASKLSALNEYFEKSLEEIRMEAGSTEKVDVSWEKLNTFFLDLVV